MNKLFNWIFTRTQKIKQRNLLHLVGGFVIGVIINILLLPINPHWFFASMVTGIAMWIIGDKWERFQVAKYNAPYSDKDIWLGVIGGILPSIIF
jgi:hypothetical protein